MYIGAIAKRSGATPKAIRLYEQLGLIGGIARQGSYRVYSDSHLRQVRLIREAQALGFRLSELAALLPAGSSEPDWPALLEQLARKREALQQEIRRLSALDEKIAEIAREIDACLQGASQPAAPLCRVVEPA